MEVRVQFLCTEILPQEAKGPGHVVEASLDVMKGTKAAASGVGWDNSDTLPGAPHVSCESLNLFTRVAEGRHEVTCAYCGRFMCVILVVKGVVIVRDVQGQCRDLKVEVVGGESSA